MQINGRKRETGSATAFHASCGFSNIPSPDPTDEQRIPIAAAKELDRLRNNWLNPPEWTRTEVLEFPGTPDGPWRRYITGAGVGCPEFNFPPAGEAASSACAGKLNSGHPTPSAIGTVRYPRVVPKDEGCAKQLKKRTLTILYNERPTWLAPAHRRLDEAVFAAYGWDAGMSDDELLAHLLELNLKRAH